MIEMTDSEYERITERFAHVVSRTFYPSPTQIEIMEQNPDKWIIYAIYLCDCGKKPETKADKYGRKLLQDFIYNHLTILPPVVQNVADEVVNASVEITKAVNTVC